MPMSNAKTTIDERMSEFIRAQQMFFVGTAPASTSGHVNLSPKGLDSFRILSPTQVAYADFVGSGVETMAHIKENGRIVIMFCAFEGAPGIVRIHGTGHVTEAADARFREVIRAFGSSEGVRSVVTIDVERVARTCGFGVPLMSFVGDRDQLPKWCDRKGPQGLLDYQRKNNLNSLDGLPGVDPTGLTD